MPATVPRLCTWYIRHVDVFGSLSEREADALAQAMTRCRFGPGQLIVKPDTQPEVVYVTRAGTVRLFHRDSAGQETTVDRLYSGQMFGVTALLGEAGGGLLAQAETEVELCEIDAHRFLTVMANWPAALLQLALRLGVRVRGGDQLLGHLTATGARARLAAVLHRLARDASETQPGGGLRLRAVPKHADLAIEIGATRETVTRMLARLERDGYIRRFGRQIVVPDVARLADDFDLRL